jgi:enoyl-CoA hydratase
MTNGERSVRTDMQGEVAVVTLARPDKRNALDVATLTAIREAQREAEAGGARAMLLHGEGPVFCAGADLSGVRESDFHQLLNEVLVAFTELPFPVLAHAHGSALGAGVQLLAVSDLRVATAECVIGVPAARLGLVVHHWTVQRLVREFTPAVARAMLLAAETYDATRLHAIGAVHRIGDFDQALQWAHELSRMAPLSMRGHKLALDADSLTDAVRDSRVVALDSDDAREGRLAFSEKRPPRFSGR